MAHTVELGTGMENCELPRRTVGFEKQSSGKINWCLVSATCMWLVSVPGASTGSTLMHVVGLSSLLLATHPALPYGLKPMRCAGSRNMASCLDS
ncbi:hypothetical protein H310_15390 [Aphanomyces invadans]|uniref:Uncharacterized protein n=1 Tax=Aphanomyces invadans TaxID=157072 RepID=A0A024T871_9STRA|nr:hypothetical protein H310_15390 [Aphanomyces invadans]ETV89781.1 hypothetical protein H310_15390 [Aphanomyces invadans]|eukprot:XP_008881587.1 hypothetical protein H310_15390 [Aphanomyces invadans]